MVDKTGPPRPAGRGTRVLCPPQPITGSAATTQHRAHAARISHSHPASEETTRQPRDHLVLPEALTMDVKPADAEPAVNRDDPRQADLAHEDPPVQPDNARPRYTLYQRLSVGHAGGKPVELPGTCSGHPTNTGYT